ncbi:nickel/cobalt transporter [Celerinatantimonas yamalensis]|uniref:Nickel/cobalt efflux system n=1 Tax=Celerinatantimonas yamalensis TaxID=559956 RepID=A0ABW9G881_9GAMM
MKSTLSNRLLALVAAILLLAAIWQYWPVLLLTSMQAQQQIYSHFDTLLVELSDHQWHAAWMLIALSLVYGVFHAVGPGHGKVVMSSYLATHRAQLKTSLMLTMAAAIMQAVVAISIVTLLRFVLTQTAHQVNNNALNIIHFNSLLVIALGIWLAIQAIRKSLPKRTHYRQFAPIKPVSALQQPFRPAAQCGCGHAHAISPTQLAKASHWRDYVALIVSIGARPCSGALLVLTVSALMGIYWIGVASALVMAIGTGSTTSLLAALTVTARGLLSKAYGNHKPHPMLTALPAALGALILILLGVTLYQMPPMAGMPGFLVH